MTSKFIDHAPVTSPRPSTGKMVWLYEHMHEYGYTSKNTNALGLGRVIVMRFNGEHYDHYRFLDEPPTEAKLQWWETYENLRKARKDDTK